MSRANPDGPRVVVEEERKEKDREHDEPPECGKPPQITF